MNLQDLRCFVALGEELSFTRAARRLHMAQPPLSRRIAALEARLAITLLRRERPLALTEGGRFLLEQAQQILARCTEVEEAVRRMGTEQRHYFGIGFVGSTLYGAFPGAIRRLREARPDVQVGLQELTTFEQRSALLNRQIDIGFGRLDLGDSPDLVREVLAEEPLWLAIARSHRWQGRAEVKLTDIAGEPFITFPKRQRPSFADQTLSLFGAEQLQPRVVLEATDLQTALGLVAAGVGVTLVPSSVAEHRREDIDFLALADPHARSSVIVSYRKSDTSPLLHFFLQLVETERAGRRASALSCLAE